MKTKHVKLILALTVFLPLISPFLIQTGLAQANCLENPGFEDNVMTHLPVDSYSESLLGAFSAPIHDKIKTQNTFITISPDKPHTGLKSLKVEVTPETSKVWLANPVLPDFAHALTFRATFFNFDWDKLFNKRVKLSFWAYLESGSSKGARVMLRKWDEENIIEKNLISIDIKPLPGQWIEYKGEETLIPVGNNSSGKSTKYDILGTFDVRNAPVKIYFDDFYFGLAKP